MELLFELCLTLVFSSAYSLISLSSDPHQADVIMALAGSNGGSWSTTYTPNSTARPSTGENRIPSGENDAAIALLRDLHARPSDKGESHRGFGSGD